MRKYISVVIEYKEGQDQPSFHADMELLGGKVTGVMFDDALKKLEEVEELLEEERLDYAAAIDYELSLD